MRASISLAVTVMALMAACVVGWGPVSHYSFACQGVQAYQSVSRSGIVPPLLSCICPSGHSHKPSKPMKALDPLLLMTGADLPDAFFFGQYFSAGASCPLAAPAWHDPFFGGLLIQAALNSSDYDGLAVGMGFASHIVADAVGFYSDAQRIGVLGNGSALVQWLAKWAQMSAIDAYVLSNITAANPKCSPAFPTQSLAAPGIAFLTQVAAAYHAASPSFPAFSSAEVGACTSQWGPLLNQMTGLAGVSSRGQFQQQIVYFDVYGAKTPQKALKNVDLAGYCSVKAIAFYFQQLIDNNASAQSALLATLQFIAQLFQSNMCGPY